MKLELGQIKAAELGAPTEEEEGVTTGGGADAAP